MTRCGLFPLGNDISSIEFVVPGNVFFNREASVSFFAGLVFQVGVLAVTMANRDWKVSNSKQVIFQVAVSPKSWKSSCSPVAVDLPVEVIDESGLNANNADNKKDENGWGLHFQKSERRAEEVDSWTCWWEGLSNLNGQQDQSTCLYTFFALLLFGKSGFFLSFLLKGAVMLAVEKTGGLLALSHNAAVSSGPLAGFPQPATVALVVAEAHRKTFFLWDCNLKHGWRAWTWKNQMVT